MTNAERRELLTLTKQAQSNGFQGSVLDVLQNPATLQEFSNQIQDQQKAQPRDIETMSSPEQQQQGLRGRERQDAPGAMVFPNIPANTPFNTVGMKFPVDIEKRDNMGHLIESHKNVPPGLVNIGTGAKEGTVIESPAQKQGGGLFNQYRTGGDTDAPKKENPLKDRSHLSKSAVKEFQKILKKEGLYTGTIDGNWGPGTETAFANSKTFSVVEPSFKEGLIRSILPSNVAQLVNKQTGSAKMGDNSLSKNQRRLLLGTIEKAKKRTGADAGGTEYIDYNKDIEQRINRGKDGDIGSVIANTLTDKKYKLATTVGRGRYWPDPDNPGGYIYTDVYDWGSGEKDFKGDNTYQILRNTVRAGEDKELSYDKNNDFRMNFRIHPNEFKDTSLPEKKEKNINLSESYKMLPNWSSMK